MFRCIQNSIFDAGAAPHWSPLHPDKTQIGLASLPSNCWHKTCFECRCLPQQERSRSGRLGLHMACGARRRQVVELPLLRKSLRDVKAFKSEA